MRKALSTIALAACCITAAAQASDPAEAVRREWLGQTVEKSVYVSQQGDSLPYNLLTPQNPKAGRRYPLVIFLHGSGERGNDNKKQLLNGWQMWLNPVNRERYPAFVLFPQCPKDNGWAILDEAAMLSPDKAPNVPETPAMTALHELLGRLLVRDDIDTRRIYIMGLSMGGLGTFDMVSRYPDIFAAAIPICGAIHPARLAHATKTRWRIFHGDADPTVPVEASRMAYLALKAAGAKVEYIEFPGCQHDSWTYAFRQPDFMQWLFKQKK